MPTDVSRPGLSVRLHLVLGLLATVVGAVWALDAMVQARHPTNATPAPLAGSGPPSSRVFVFLIDSLRWQVATDPEVMPFLATAHERAVVAQVLPPRDAVTTSGLQDAFTGTRSVQLFSFVKDFVRDEEDLRSVFGLLQAQGRTSVVYSDGSFGSFGTQITEAFPIVPSKGRLDLWDEGADASQRRAVEEGLRRFLAGSDALVVVHVTYGDHCSHVHPVGSGPYNTTFRELDALARHLAETIPESDTLIVMGDHGHDELGRHGLGQNVPTFAFWRGPGFRQGLGLGALPISKHYYFLTWALGLPLGRYDGNTWPQALAADPVPSPFAARPVETSSRHPAPLLPALALCAQLGLVVAAWALEHGRRRKGAGTWTRSAMTWSLTALLPLASRSAWLSLLGLMAGSALVVADPLLGRRQGWLAAAGGAALGLAFAGWGLLWDTYRTLLQTLELTFVLRFWLVMAALAIFASARVGTMRTTWAIVGASALLLPPTVYCCGWAAAMVPAWLVFVLLLFLEGCRARRVFVPGPPLRLLDVGALVLFIPLVAPFFFTHGDNFQTSGFWGPFLPQSAWHWAAAALIAKWVILMRPSRGLAANLPSAAIAAMLLLIQWGTVELGSWATLVLVALCGVGSWALARRASPTPLVTQLQLASAVGGLWLAYHGFCQLPKSVYFISDMMIAGLVLTAHLLRRWGTRLSSGWLLLQCLAVTVAGWSTLAWTVHRLEWHVLYDFFGAGFVEDHVWAFLPLVVARYGLPLVLIRRLLSDFEPRSTATGAWLAVAAKLVGTVAILIGMGCYDAFKEEYLEAAQHIGVLGALALGLAYEPRAQASPELRIRLLPRIERKALRA